MTMCNTKTMLNEKQLDFEIDHFFSKNSVDCDTM